MFICTFLFKPDNILIIGGSRVYFRFPDFPDYGNNDKTGFIMEHVSNTTLVSMPKNNGKCIPLDLDYPLHDHSSVLAAIGIITCGGRTGSDGEGPASSKCILQSIEGKTVSFPSMVRKRADFGLSVIDDKLFAIGGNDDFGTVNTMETINIGNNKKHWNEEKLPFNITDSCTVTIKNYIVLIGGFDGEKVSKNLESANKK